MARIQDVAAYILGLTGVTSTMKLQKLAFYSHAYHLVNFGEPLFEGRIEAWPNGPVIKPLFSMHARKFLIDASSFPSANPARNLSARQKASIEYVVDKLGGMSGNQLSALTHSEKPWLDQRTGLHDSQPTNREISDYAICSFYARALPSNPLFA